MRRIRASVLACALLVSGFTVTGPAVMPVEAQGYYGPCAPSQWEEAYRLWLNLPKSTYEEQSEALDGFFSGILPGLGYGCQYEFQTYWMMSGVPFVWSACQGANQGQVCMTDAQVRWINQALQMFA
jgi:hypothetical protein